MRKSELLSLVAGVKIQSKKDSTVYEIVGMDAEAGKYILTNGKTYSTSTMIRWFDLYEEEIPEPVQPIQPTIIEEKHEDDQLHDQHDTTTKTHTTEGNTATTSDKITKDDIIYIIEHSNCDAVVKKQYIGAYREDYKGAVCMVRTTKKGNTHIDMKQGIFNSLAESTRNRLEANYNAKVYDSTRGYIRLFEVDDLRVLQDLIVFALETA